jgi:hypothetical protein
MKALLSRLAEPSSWAGIAAFLGLVGVHVPTETFKAISLAGSGVAAAAAVLIPEKKK